MSGERCLVSASPLRGTGRVLPPISVAGRGCRWPNVSDLRTSDPSPFHNVLAVRRVAMFRECALMACLAMSQREEALTWQCLGLDYLSRCRRGQTRAMFRLIWRLCGDEVASHPEIVRWRQRRNNAQKWG
ncbi:hypothetical protein M3J09_009459 [Ascochyta lentis]